jgi:hypothetical protein
MFSSAPAAAEPPAGAPPPPPPPPPTEPVPVVPPTEAVPPVPPPPPTQAFTAPPPGAPPPPPPGAAGEPPEKKKNRAPLFILLALIVLAAVIGGFLLLGGDDDGGGGDEILLEPIGFRIDDDFFGELDVDTPGDNVEVALGELPELEDGIEAAGAGKTAPGDQPGVFGGNRDQAVCDVDELVSQIEDDDNEDKTAAFAEAIDVDVDDLADAVASLTAVRLRFDTRVTNHSFSGGNARPQQSILEKGTAVLVDDEGVPKVKCNGGSPLAEPDDVGDLSDDEALDESVLQNPDDAWDGFELEQVVVIDDGDPVDAFTLVDIDTGELFDRPVGTNGDADTDVGDFDTVCEVIPDSPTCVEVPETTTTTEGEETTTTTAEGTTTTVILGTGDVQVTLEWDSDADLDLSVADPTGTVIDFGNQGPTETGGELDVDSNVGCENDGSVENIFWPPGQAPVGDYVATVTGYLTESCGQGAQSGDFVLTIRVAGQPDQVLPGTVGEGTEAAASFPFTV